MDTRRRAYEILDKKDLDDKVKLEAAKIINDSTMKYMDILTHNETVKTVMSWNDKANKQLLLEQANHQTVAEDEQSKKDKANNELFNQVANSINDTTRTEETSNSDTDSGTGDSTKDSTDRTTTESDNTTGTPEQDSRVF
jgi:hypothetical protein